MGKFRGSGSQPVRGQVYSKKPANISTKEKQYPILYMLKYLEIILKIEIALDKLLDDLKSPKEIKQLRSLAEYFDRNGYLSEGQINLSIVLTKGISYSLNALCDNNDIHRTIGRAVYRKIANQPFCHVLTRKDLDLISDGTIKPLPIGKFGSNKIHNGIFRLLRNNTISKPNPKQSTFQNKLGSWGEDLDELSHPKAAEIIVPPEEKPNPIPHAFMSLEELRRSAEIDD